MICRNRAAVAIAFAALAWSMVGTGAGAAARPLQASDFLRLVGLSAPAISLDGKRAVVVVSRIVWNDDTNSSDLDLIDLVTRARRTITHDRKDLDAPAF